MAFTTDQMIEFLFLSSLRDRCLDLRANARAQQSSDAARQVGFDEIAPASSFLPDALAELRAVKEGIEKITAKN